LDILRQIKKFDNISFWGAEYIIIKEVNNNFYIGFKKKKQFDIQLFNPQDFLKIFPYYEIFKIYSTRFLFYIEKPNSL